MTQILITITKGKIKDKTYYSRQGQLDTIATVWETEKEAEEGRDLSTAILMPNNEVIRKGKTLGFMKKKETIKVITKELERLEEKKEELF